jgi:Mg2+/citrate symporter
MGLLAQIFIGTMILGLVCMLIVLFWVIPREEKKRGKR